MQRRGIVTTTAAVALAVSGWTAALHAQALSGDPDQNRKAGVAAGKEVNGAVGVRSSDNNPTAGANATVNGTSATGTQANSAQGQVAAADGDGIRRTLSEVTEAVLKPDGIGQISQYIAGEDANRLRNIGEKNSILDSQIQKFQQNWKQKYNQDFAIKDQQLVLNDRNVQIVPGAIVSGGATGGETAGATGSGTGGATGGATAGAPSNVNTGGTAIGSAGSSNQNTASAQNATAPGAASPNTTAANASSSSPNATAATAVNPNPTAANSQTPNPNPTAAPNNAPNVEATPASARQAGSNATANNTTVAGTITGGNNNVATVIIPASHNMPEASIVVTREAAANPTGATSATAETWKLDVPNSTDTRQIQQNLARQLRALNEAKGTWPASATEATNMVTHAVVLALSQPGQYPTETRTRPLNNNANRTGAQQQSAGATRSNVGGGTGSTGAATGVGGTGSGTTGAGSTGSQSTGAGPSDNNTTGAGSTGSGGQNP